MSQAIFATISAFSGYADDGSDVIYGDSIRECNEKLRAVVDQRRAWYRDMGLVLNDKKTEILGINFIPDPITIEDIVILPKSEITFLGVTIQSDLKWSSHIQSLRGKIYAAANRIRTEARHLSITDRRILYFGWVQGYIISNGLAYLPTLNKTEQLSLQTAANAAVRAVVGLPRYGQAEISSLRKNSTSLLCRRSQRG